MFCSALFYRFLISYCFCYVTVVVFVGNDMGLSLAQFATWLRELSAGEPAQVAVAIETLYGAMVDRTSAQMSR